MRLLLAILLLALPSSQSVKPVPQESRPNPKGTAGQDDVQRRPSLKPESSPQQATSQHEENDGKATTNDRVYPVDIRSLPFPPPDPWFHVYVLSTVAAVVIALGSLVVVLKQVSVYRNSERAWIVVTPATRPKPNSGVLLATRERRPPVSTRLW
jgi:hypothetical protein